MRLLILTQTVNQRDPILGFFHRWIEEFSKKVESVTVICLEKGEYQLPENVKVLSLGKEKGVSKWKYIKNFYKYIWEERKNYNRVFVHMNPEYVIMGGLFWRLRNNKVVLWYTHKNVDLKLKLAVSLANMIMSASPESFRYKTSKLMIMGHGIDVDFFSTDEEERGDHWLSVGRLMPSKRHDVVIRESVEKGRELRIAGDGPEFNNLSSLAESLGARVKFLGPLTQQQLRDEYRKAALLVHRSETGSLDKVVLEAAACGLSVDSTDPAISKMPLSREYVVKEHNISSLIYRIVEGIK